MPLRRRIARLMSAMLTAGPDDNLTRSPSSPAFEPASPHRYKDTNRLAPARFSALLSHRQVHDHPSQRTPRLPASGPSAPVRLRSSSFQSGDHASGVERPGASSANGLAAQLALPETPYSYTVIDQDLTAALHEFGSNLNIKVNVSPEVRGRIQGVCPSCRPRLSRPPRRAL